MNETTEQAYARGVLESTVQDHERRLAAINGNIAAFSVQLGGVREELARVGTRVAVGGVLAGFAGSGITALIVFFLTK